MQHLSMMKAGPKLQAEMRKQVRKKTLLLLLLMVIILLPAAQATEPNALAFTSELMEKAGDSAWQVIDSRNYVAGLGSSFQFSMGNFSCDLNATQVSEETVEIEYRIISFDFSQRNFFDDKLVDLGTAIFVDSLLVRENSYYRVRISVDSLVTYQPECEYRFRANDFAFDPSGDFDFYFVRNALGDYRWNEIRSVIEQNYDYIRQRINFRDPTKINYYICPCLVSDMGWDRRWGNALDLGRNNLFVHYTHGINTIQVPTVFMLKLLRQWGYAPAVVLEGAASMVEFCDLFAQDYYRQNTLPVIAELGVSLNFRALDRKLSTYAAGSFFQYLIATRSLNQFSEFYRRVTDLTFTETFASVYGEKIETVEGEWHGYLDTLTLSAALYEFYHYRSSTQMKYDEALLFLDRELAVTDDTLHLGPRVANLFFYFGDYEQAERIYEAVAGHDSAQAIAASYLANLKLAQGKLEHSEALYYRTLAEDTATYLPELKLATIQHHRGEYKKAVANLHESKAKTGSVPIKVDINIALGDAFTALGQRDSARYYFSAALDTAKLLLGNFNDRPLYHLRAGKAALRLGEGEIALEFLQRGFFLEERMFYIGQILLALGQAYDVLGRRREAKQEYEKLWRYPTAWLDRQQAKVYLKEPYRYD